jgi:hypothetical protein
MAWYVPGVVEKVKNPTRCPFEVSVSHVLNGAGLLKRSCIERCSQ